MLLRFIKTAIIFTGLFCFTVIYCQEDECLTRLDNAEILFNSGIFEEIPLLLEDCLEFYPEDDKQKAFRLITLAYYMNDDVESAEITMMNLLQNYPAYRPGAGDQAEFQFVFESFRVRKIVDLGFFIGTLFTPGSIEEPFSPFEDRFTYDFRFPGITTGAMVNFPITNHFSITTEPSIAQYAFHIQYDNAINGIYQIDQTEKNILVQLPVNLRFTLLSGQFQPYIKIGGKFSILLSAETESKLERLDPETGEIIHASDQIKRDHSEFREKMYYYVGGGVGMRMNFNKYYIFGELNYYHPLNYQLAAGQNRYGQSNLWTEAWMDSDFKVLHTSFRIGISRTLYSIKKTRL